MRFLLTPLQHLVLMIVLVVVFLISVTNAKADDVPWQFAQRVANLEKRVTVLEKQTKALRDANHLQKQQKATAAPHPCTCGCEETGQCKCPNCSTGCGFLPRPEKVTGTIDPVSPYPPGTNWPPYDPYHPYPVTQVPPVITPWMDIGPGNWQLGTTPFVAPLIPVGQSPVFGNGGGCAGGSCAVNGTCSGGSCSGGSCGPARPGLFGRLFRR